MRKLTFCVASVLLSYAIAQTDLEQDLWDVAEKVNQKLQRYEYNRWFAAANIGSASRELNINSPGSTSLHKAAAANLPVVVSELVTAGADKDILQDNGMTPLFLATLLHNTDSAKALLDGGADPNIPFNDDGEILATLTIAMNHQNIDLVKALLEAGANPDVSYEPYRFTPLMKASYQHSDKHLIIFKALLDANANIGLEEVRGQTALHVVAINRSLDHTTNQQTMAQLLLRKGADAKKKDHDGKTPADIARENGNDELANFIENYSGPYDNSESVFDLYELVCGVVMFMIATIL